MSLVDAILVNDEISSRIDSKTAEVEGVVTSGNTQIQSILQKISLKALQHLQDLKQYGSNSYVYQMDSVLEELCMCPVASNDKVVRQACFNSVVEKGFDLGTFLGNVEGVAGSWVESIHTLSDVITNEACISEITSNSVIMELYVNNTEALTSVSLTSLFRSYFKGSSVAYSAVSASSLLQEITGLTTDSTWRSTELGSGNIYILAQKQEESDSTEDQHWIRTSLDEETVKNTLKKDYNTYFKVHDFFSGASLQRYSDVACITSYKYIELGGVL